jgi:hypothetical protein
MKQVNLTPDAAAGTIPPMGLMLLLNAQNSALMWLSLVGAVALTAFEANQMKLDYRRQIWWVLLVSLVHAPGYIALRIWRSRRDGR